MDTITDKLLEMRLVTEGAVALFEKEPAPTEDDYSLIGEALYLLREQISESLKSLQAGADKGVK